MRRQYGKIVAQKSRKLITQTANDTMNFFLSRHLTIGSKILLAFLFVGIIPFLTIGTISLIKSGNALSDQAFAQLESMRDVKRTQISDYFTARQTELNSLMQTVSTFRQSALDKLTVTQEVKKSQLERYFQHMFDDFTVLCKTTTMVNALTKFSGAFEAEGGKIGGALYSYNALKYGESLLEFRDKYGFADILLIDKQGNIVYSVDHQADEGQNVFFTPLLETSLSTCYADSIDGVSIYDFSPYSISGNDYFAFLGAPIFDQLHEKFVGTVILKLNNKSINTIINQREGQGKTCETYVVGQIDTTVSYRSDRVVKKGKIGQEKVGDDIRHALAGHSGYTSKVGSTGELELSSFSPLAIPGLHWAIISTISMEEAINPAVQGTTTDYFSSFTEMFGYDDLYLIHPDGEIFYSVARQGDYGTNILTGQYGESNLAQVVRKVLASKQFAMADLALYEPGNNKPAAFIAKPVVENDTIEMIVALKLSHDSINRIMRQRDGMGKTGESYLVGSDRLMRSDSYLDPVKHSIIASFENPSQAKVETEASLAALSGKTGRKIIDDYNGVRVLSAFCPLQLGDTVWAVIVKINAAEAFAPVKSMKVMILFIALVGLVLIIIIALLTTRSITAPMKHLTSVAEKVSKGNMELRTVVKTNDETMVLGSAFNHMLDTIQSQISEIQETSAELAVKQKDLEIKNEQLLHAEKLSAIGKLSASIAHEFNNPLYGVMSVIKGLKKGTALAKDDLELVEMAIEECTRMKNLIMDLQDFNRPTSGTMAPMEIHPCIDSILILTKKDFSVRKITITKDYAVQMPAIYAVADQIKQVLLNLLSNAADACEHGGTIRIATGVEKNKKIFIQIQDSGKGIHPDDLGHIFEPFFTTKPEIKGTGLGLSVSYGIITSHGGTIDVASKLDVGTIFTVTLPIHGDKDAEKNNISR